MIWTDSVLHRFYSKIRFSSNCWHWEGSKNRSSYGTFYFGGKMCMAHQVSVLLSGRDIPHNMVIDHKCMNKSCVNPKHLRAVDYFISNTENTKGTAANNINKTHCVNGHKFTEHNTLTRYNLNKKPYRACRKCVRHQNMISNRKYRARTALKECFEDFNDAK